jgi:putative ubiquitin-RnfH superfamily antitoxin RatB of RatAB toxin-antitoxin module
MLDAVCASGLAASCPGLDLANSEAGVWGRKAAPGQLLKAGDRVEVYRPLQVDPKLARRERFLRQGARGTGLFARRQAGRKAGY